MTYCWWHYHSVSTFLCTWKLGPDEVSVILSRVFSDDFLKSETQQLIIHTCWFLYHLKNCFSASLHSSCWSVVRACVLLRTTSINWPSPPEWHNFLNYVYNTYSHKWPQTHTYVYIYNPVESNYRDPTGHKNLILCTYNSTHYICNCVHFWSGIHDVEFIWFSISFENTLYILLIFFTTFGHSTY